MKGRGLLEVYSLTSNTLTPDCLVGFDPVGRGLSDGSLVLAADKSYAVTSYCERHEEIRHICFTGEPCLTSGLVIGGTCDRCGGASVFVAWEYIDPRNRCDTVQ